MECSRPHVYTWPRCLKRPHDYTYKGTRSKEEERKRDEEAERRHDVCACECVCRRNLSGRDQKVPESGVSGDEVV